MLNYDVFLLFRSLISAAVFVIQISLFHCVYFLAEAGAFRVSRFSPIWLCLRHLSELRLKFSFVRFSVLLFLPFAFVHPCILFFAAAMFSLSPSFLPCSCLSATAARKKTWGTKPSNFITEKQRTQPQSGVIIPRGEIHPSERLNLIEKCIDKSGNSVYHYVCTIFASVLTLPSNAKDLTDSQNISRSPAELTCAVRQLPPHGQRAGWDGPTEY